MELGDGLPWWSVVPFAGMLLSIAVIPLVNAEWWERRQLLVALLWSALFLVPFSVAYGFSTSFPLVAEVLLLDYLPFIVLLLGLFVVSGGICVSGSFTAGTKGNVALLTIGAVLASCVGTTGASMLLIRPVLRANAWRKYKAHVVVFFIFIVANVGGCLTPLGDPPLFLGYLRGVPFAWTLVNLWPAFLLNVILLLLVFVVVDRYFVKKEDEGAFALKRIGRKADEEMPVRVEGLHNLLFLGVIIVSVILNGAIPQMECFVNPETGHVYGLVLFGHIHVGFNLIVEMLLIAGASLGSLKTTDHAIRERNGFEWAPIAEVAKLFIGIFLTMIPAIMLLRSCGGGLGVDSPVEFFWATGALSSFLDNSPTYVVFLTMAGALGAEGPGVVLTTVGPVAGEILAAISMGAVFMGAMTYVGNAPNFMVKSIAERSGVKMPGFFGYMKWSCAVLLPVLLVDALVLL